MRSVRLMRLALVCAGALIVSAQPAWAGPNADWASKFEGQSPFLTLESGQLAQSQFTARNVGAQTWSRGFVNLATVNSPYNFPDPSRNSPFEVVNDWIGANRPTHLDQDSVPPQTIGTFTFRVRAPQVSVRTDFTEHFAPVADGHAWMACDDGCQWANVFLIYTVYPPQDPTVSIKDGARTVTQGESIDVSATAADNVGVEKVVFSLEDQQIVANASPYSASFSSADLDAGSHVVTARVYDRAGHSASDSATYSVKSSAGTGVQQPTPDPVPDVGVSINEGQIFTNRPRVRLTLHPPAGATGATISNDGLFNSSPVPVSGNEVVSWTLDSSGLERLPKTVYVHFTGPGIDASDEHHDDIILDETPPQVSNVRVVLERRGNRRPLFAKRSLVKNRCSKVHLALKVKAHDNLSKVRALSYSFSRGDFRRSGKPTTMSFGSSVPVKVPPKLHSPSALFVAVRDGALNLSKVHKVSLRSVCR